MCAIVPLFIFLVVSGITNVCNSLLNYQLMNKPTRENLSAIVLVADGTEELEAVTTIDLLRRAEVNVTVAGVAGENTVRCQFGCLLTPDASLDAAMLEGLFDLVVIPGGEEACLFMAQSDLVGKLLTDHVEGKRFIAASTAGPTVLDAHRINYLQRITSAPAFSEKLNKHYSYFDWEETIVDLPGKMITSRFPGSILEFGLAIINHLLGTKTAERVSYDLHPYTTTTSR